MFCRLLSLASLVLSPALAIADPINVVPKELEWHRLKGHAHIDPSPEVQKRIAQDPAHRKFVIVTYKVCVDTDGKVSSAELLHSSGYSDYDGEVRRAMVDDWRFRPWEVNDKTVSVCTANTQIFKP